MIIEKIDIGIGQAAMGKIELVRLHITFFHCQVRNKAGRRYRIGQRHTPIHRPFAIPVNPLGRILIAPKHSNPFTILGLCSHIFPGRRAHRTRAVNRNTGFYKRSDLLQRCERHLPVTGQNDHAITHSVGQNHFTVSSFHAGKKRIGSKRVEIITRRNIRQTIGQNLYRSIFA